MRPIIRVANLSKCWGTGQCPHSNLRDSVGGYFSAPVRWLGRRVRRAYDGVGEQVLCDAARHVWALRDVSFEVMPGEVLGIIGRSGAGKSTVLKILSRMAKPTSGTVEIYGRVGSMLEKGAGFHEQLTGRENIYLGGAILGMKRAEIQRRFDEILAFSGVEKFIDTPIKHYSTGMRERLAFAVLSHCNSEIMLLDEVLAVGDEAFQEKCRGKIRNLAKQGQTIILISHDMAEIESFCTSCMLIDSGRLEVQGEPRDVTARYLASKFWLHSGTGSLSEHPERHVRGRPYGSVPTMTHVELHSANGVPQGEILTGAPMAIRVKYEAQRSLRPVLGVTIRTLRGTPVFSVSDRYCGQLASCEPSARGTVVCTINKLPLMPGSYILDLWFGDSGADLDVIFDAISFDVLPADVTGNGRPTAQQDGLVFCEATWRLIHEKATDAAYLGNRILSNGASEVAHVVKRSGRTVRSKRSKTMK